MLRFINLQPDVHPDQLGLIPSFLSEDDPDNAVAQFNKNYAHGGGWYSIKGFTLNNKLELKYPGDPKIAPLAISALHGREVIIIYPHGFVAVRDGKTGTVEVARLD